MSRINELIAEHCPDGVEHKPLSAVGTLFNGLTGKSKADFAVGNARFVSYVNVFNNIETNVAPNDFVHVRVGERQNRVRYGDVLFTASSESADEVGMASGVTVEPPEPLYLNSFCFGFRPTDPADLDPAFAKHLFRSEGLRRQIIRTANGVTRINISKNRFRDIRIPVLPVAVQREIASILDKMESLTAELEAELEAELDLRGRQYAFYRDELLTFREVGGVRWVPMGEVGEFTRGRRFTKNDIAEVLGDDLPGLAELVVEPLGGGVVAEVAVDDGLGPGVVGVVGLDPGADAVPAFVVGLGLHGQAGLGVDEEPELVFGGDWTVPPREVPVLRLRGQRGATLTLLLLGDDDLLERRLRGQTEKLLHAGEELVAHQ